MPQLIIVADDLTGAADTGASFADAGLATVIALPGTTAPDADVVVLSSESRDLEEDAAATAVSSALTGIIDAGSHSDPRWVYKKIDSALRGHPRAELLTVMTVIGAMRAVVAPAFPSEGRTTVGGRQHIDGIPLESSRFGGSGTNSDLIAVFQNDFGLPIDVLDLETIRNRPDEIRQLLDSASDGIVIADAESDEDLFALAGAASASRLRLLCGTAGFARQLARSLPLTPQAATPLERARGSGSILVVAGSQHDATARQIHALREAGVPIVLPDQSLIDDPAVAIDDTVGEAAAHLASGRSLALTTVGLDVCSRGGNAVAARLAQVVTAPDVASRVGGLVLTGGDIAAAVCGASDVKAIWLKGEISPGLPWGVLAGGPLHGRPVATKAGSFGGDAALLMCIDRLMSERSVGTD